MELYILAVLLFIYMITVIVNNADTVRKIWTCAFIVAGFLSAVSLFALRIKHQDVMLAADNLNWYFFLYVFGAMAFALGIINLWIYRRALWQMLHSASADNSAKE